MDNFEREKEISAHKKRTKVPNEKERKKQHINKKTKQYGVTFTWDLVDCI